MSVTAFNRMRRLKAEQEVKESKKTVIQEVKNASSYEDMTVKELEVIAKEKGIEKYYDMKKAELIAVLEGLEGDE